LLEYTKKINFEPDIIHVNDYHTALVPVLLKTEFARDPFFSQVRTLLTIHNLGNQGIDALHLLDVVGLKGNSTPNLALDTRDGDIDLLDEGIAEADIVVAVSPTYSKEILTPEYGEGLQDLLQRRQDRLFGVLNGIDTEVYDPEVDPNLFRKFSLNKLGDRPPNKSALIQEFKMEEPELPIVGMVTRIVGQKGFDLVLEIGDKIGQLPLNLVILGLGDKNFEQGLAELAKKYPNIKVDLEFSEAKSRRIYAGSDFFLIPSRFEPCGLTQMIAMRYGAVPIVRQTGGLADTVTEGKTGVVFTAYKSDSLLKALQEALDIYKDKKVLSDLQQRGMRLDLSWNKSANEYVNLYQKALKLPMKLP
jgi:starch synthase